MNVEEAIVRFSRRKFLKSALGLGLALGLGSWSTVVERLAAQPREGMKTRPIPSGGEELPVVGVGTSGQFDVDSRPEKLEPLRGVLKSLFQRGGSVIDTSPMYGRAEPVVGTLLESMDARKRAFVATKVWTRGRENGVRQMNQSMEKLRVSTVDLMQVHNLVDWETHLRTLNEWKRRGRIRYTGITHYTRPGLDALEEILTDHAVDFVQLPYSIGLRKAEDRVLPLARDRGVAVLVNRPFRDGALFRSVRGASLPSWSDEIDCSSWAQYFLKFILGHPAVTCVIPGTSNPKHMVDNARAGTGRFPNARQRERMVRHWNSL